MPRVRCLLNILCLSVLLLATLSACANADLALVGGTDHERDSIAAAFECFPACCKGGCHVTVQLMSGPALMQVIRAGIDSTTARSVNIAAIDGVYENLTPTILLRGDGDCTQMCRTFAHEFGHCVWRRMLTAADQDRYAQVYSTQKAAHHLITPYAETNVEEGFAEAYSYFVTDRPALDNRDQLSSAFLTDLFARLQSSSSSSEQSACPSPAKPD